MCASRLSLHSSQKHQYIVVSPKLYLYRCHFVIRDPVFLVERVESAVPHLFGTARWWKRVDDMPVQRVGDLVLVHDNA